ncbi:hypothetical protein [Hespellia stercorisuis]|uniref:Uncharacterized protein n=1 Tax=Hespellia stercorisuis DSM 15480 TaxID=1121950 RepID=A0A1M6UED2_9FIRM|nr:hypothetical protein [Hespellia stercorisuis]SHK67605.1 hypothetical protein SAMN02745243_03484 [Hespellia stercorisuis DSM 15480]
MNDPKHDHRKKMIAPIIVTILLIIYFLIYALLITLLVPSAAVKIGGGLLCLALSGVTIKVAVERVKEIRSGEEDDLSKY